MKKILLLFLIAIMNTGIAQVAINTSGTAPDASAMLDIKSTTSGLLIPRMSATDRDNITTPATGLLIYVTDDNNFYYFDGANWINLSTQPDEDWKVDGNDMYSIPTGNVGIGTTTPREKLEVNGNIRGGDTYQGAIVIQSDYGSTIIGARNSGFSHFYTDMPRYYFNKKIVVDEGIVSSYNEDLQLQTAYTTHMTISKDDGNIGIAVSPNTNNLVSAASGNFSNVQFLLNTNTDGIGLVSNGNNLTSYWTRTDGAGIIANGTNVAVQGFTELDDDDAIAMLGQYMGTTQTNATGVVGYSMPASTYGYGVKGFGGKVGVYGETDSSGFYGVLSNGDFGATGTKTFIIDHPLDPSNKYLKHFSIESNEVLNMYRGNVVLDANGNANIKLPRYFKAINKNFSYMLTPVGQPAPGIYVAKEINDIGEFTIAGGQPGQKISWYVYAERNDPYLQQHPEKRQVEVLKKDKERGKYLMPDLYNQPNNMRIDFEQKNLGKVSKKKYIVKPSTNKTDTEEK